MDRTVVSQHNINLLDSNSSSCYEIQQSLKEHLANTSNAQYKSEIEKDIITLENLKLILYAIKKDIQYDKVGVSTELLLRIAANDFKKKLALIPENKTLCNRVTKSLKEVHRNIFRQTHASFENG